MSGSGSLTKQGAGLLALGGTNTYSGGTSVNAGALLGNSQSVQGHIQNQAAVMFDQTAAGTYSGNMSGTGSLVKQGNGLLIMSGANTYAGGTLVSAGTLQGDTRSLQGDILNQGAVVFDQAAPGIYAGNMAGTGSLTKRGLGAVNMTGDFSQFSGSTTIASGLLSVNGSFGGSSLLVQSGGMLGGNGLMPTITLQGGTLAPGMSIGTAHVSGDVTFGGGSFYRVETESYGVSDRTVAAGQLTAGGGTLTCASAARAGTGRSTPTRSSAPAAESRARLRTSPRMRVTSTRRCSPDRTASTSRFAATTSISPASAREAMKRRWLRRSTSWSASRPALSPTSSTTCTTLRTARQSTP